MSLSDKQNAVLGFLKAACDNGMTPDDVVDFIIVATTELKPDDPFVKEAAAFPLALASQTGNLLSNASQWAVPLALLAPPVVGAAGGAMLAAGEDLDEGETKEIQNKRLLGAYQANIAKLKAKNRIESRT